jgi:hypothetical protein
VDGHAELLAPCAQGRQQPLAADRGEAMPARSQNLPAVVDVDVIPNRKVMRQPFKEGGIGLLYAAQRFV